jgi:hypothetical protein
LTRVISSYRTYVGSLFAEKPFSERLCYTPGQFLVGFVREVDARGCRHPAPSHRVHCWPTVIAARSWARCRELLGMTVTPRSDTATSDPDPIMPPVQEATVTPTRVCPRCGAGRIVVVAEFPPMPPAEGIRADPETVPGPRQLIIEGEGFESGSLFA